MSLPLLLPLLLMQATPTFEVASFKAVDIRGSDSYTINLGKTLHGELTLGNATLADCLKFAYSLSSDIQLAGPDWIASKMIRFDIVARSSPDTSREQLLLMLQNLLAERFRLTLHREPRQESYLALTQSKKGIKLEPVDVNTPLSNNQFRPGNITSKGLYMHMLATVLARFMRQPVLDQTGLQGRYAVNLEWTPEPGEALLNGGQPGPGPSIYTAVQEQLGLRLESRKGPVEVLVVDRAEQVPIAN